MRRGDDEQNAYGNERPARDDQPGLTDARTNEDVPEPPLPGGEPGDEDTTEPGTVVSRPHPEGERNEYTGR